MPVKPIALSLKAEGTFIMNSDNATCGGSAWSTQAVNDFMYACGVGECSNSSEIRETTERPVVSPVSIAIRLIRPCLSPVTLYAGPSSFLLQFLQQIKPHA